MGARGIERSGRRIGRKEGNKKNKPGAREDFEFVFISRRSKIRQSFPSF